MAKLAHRAARLKDHIEGILNYVRFFKDKNVLQTLGLPCFSQKKKKIMYAPMGLDRFKYMHLVRMLLFSCISFEIIKICKVIKRMYVNYDIPIFCSQIWHFGQFLSHLITMADSAALVTMSHL